MPEKDVDVAEVKGFRTQSGNTRFVLRDAEGNEYTTFKEPIARQAVAAEGRRARIEFHEQQRNGFTNVYLDKVEPLEEEEPESGAGGVEAEELFGKLQPFKELVADDIRDDDGEDDTA